eukprot:jgi/Tetstr1/434766/TSEL_023817.t1
MFATCTRAAALAAALLILAVLAASQSVDLSAEDCAAFQLGQTLWMGAVGISGLEGVRLPGSSGFKELGLNQVAAIKWFVDGMGPQATGLRGNGTSVDFYALDSHANGDPRKALALATEVCTDPEAENRLLGFFGGISSEESKSVQLVASTFGYSQVSPVSEGQELSDKTRYPTFNRVFSPSFKLAPAMVDVIQHFGWQKIGIVSGETAEDFSSVRSLQSAAKSAGIEILSIVNTVSSDAEAVAELVHYMNSELLHVRVWVMFFTRDSVQSFRFFSYAAGTQLTRAENVFLEGGRLGDFVHTMKGFLQDEEPPEEWQSRNNSVHAAFEAMSGVLSVGMSKGAGSARYGAFLDSINAIGIPAWMGPGLGDTITPDVKPVFEGIEQLDYGDMLHSTASMTYDALDVFVRAADSMVADGLACRVVGPHRNHSLYLDYIRAQKFEGVSGYLAFDENGDRVSDYSVYNLQFDPSTSGKERTGNLKPERIMSWRHAPPDGEAHLTPLPNAQVQWRSGHTGPPPADAPPPSPSTQPDSDAGDRSSTLITALASAAAVFLACLLVAGVLLLFCHLRRKHQVAPSGVLDGSLLKFERRPVFSNPISTELQGKFMFRDVRIHVLNSLAAVPPGAVLIRCKAGLEYSPANGLFAVHKTPGSPGCVSQSQPTVKSYMHLQSRTDVIVSSRNCVEMVRHDRGGHGPQPINSGEAQGHLILPSVALQSLTPLLKLLLGEGSQWTDTGSHRPATLPTIPDDIESAAGLAPADPHPSAGSNLREGPLSVQLGGSFTHGVAVKGNIRRRFSVQSQPMIAELQQSVVQLMKLHSPRLQPILGMTFIGSGSQLAPAIVAEHFLGGNLHDMVHNNATPLDIDVRVQLLTDIASGLKTLHSQQPPIVHPNISPYNILLNDDMHAVLTQYGYRTVLGAENGGLLQYAAPEVLAGEKPTPESDVFSWGIIAIEVMERSHLYDGMDVSSVLRGVRDDWLRPNFGEACPPSIMELLVECTAKNPRRRPSAAEVVLRLQEVSRTLQDAAASLHETANSLLNSIFPPGVATQLRNGERVEPEQHPEVTVFFSDIVGFTNISSILSPAEVMEMLNRLYILLDKLTAKHGLFKVETIGDAYMAVGNLHPKAGDHTARIARFALEALSESSTLAVHHDRPELGCIQMRAGFHTGPVVASVIGDLNPRYCLFGDTVNTSSRMESTSLAGRVHLSHAAYRALQQQAPEIRCTQRDDLGEIKGKGKMKTYFLDVPLPPVNHSPLLGDVPA